MLKLRWKNNNRALRKMKNQVLKFISIQAKIKRCCRSCQQEYQEDYVEDDNHVQGLT
jgi:hypothetical protein